MIAKIFILAIIGISSALVTDFSEEITDNIFKNNEPYLILVTTSTDHQIIIEFQEYCSSRNNCTILSSSNNLYEHITSFIGYEGQHYFLIIDAHQHLKYILPITTHIDSIKTVTLTPQLSTFEAQFESEDLKPFFASEDPLQSDRDEACARLVGSTYQDFLVEDEPVKIVYLYTKSSFCQICEDLLTKFKVISQKYRERGVIRFGFIDVLKNDNRFIKDEIIPYFLIYIDENFDDPYGVGADQFEQLQEYVQKLIEDVKGSRFTSRAAAGREEF